MSNTILLIGAGNLGSRYLQGLKAVNSKIIIYVYDIFEESLIKAKNYYDIIPENIFYKEIFFINKLDKLPNSFDIIIISTTSNVRLKIIEELLIFNIKFKNLILEKVLAQNFNNIDKILFLLRNHSNVWINTPRRMMYWYNTIKSNLKSNIPIKMSIRGGDWGLACNSIHFIDLINYFTGEYITNIITAKLNNKWEPSKRVNFFEVFGELNIYFSNGSHLILESNQILINTYIIKFQQLNSEWEIDEKLGVAKNSNGLLINGELTLQSKLTPILVEKLINSNSCELTDLHTSAKLHTPLIESLLSHWNISMNKKDNFLPIT
jgi:predicted dehydrogenase